MKSSSSCLALIFLVGGACATPSQPSQSDDVLSGVLVQAGREFQLRPGESVRIDGTTSRLVFRGVADDSRCPADVQCVWQGNARVLLTLFTEGQPDRAIVVNTGVEPRSAVVAGYALKVTSLAPVPRVGATIPPDSYVARFELAVI